MARTSTFYGMRGCSGLAGLYDGGSSELATQNADNYRLFAEASYLQSRRWDPEATN